jgi:hypothetical protein
MRCLVLCALTLGLGVAQAQDLEVQQPKGTWQQPKEIQVPKGPWQEPGEIQVPKGIQAVTTIKEECEERLSVVADALFDFDKSSLRADAEETLDAAGPEIAKLGGKPSMIEGHTDSKGADEYTRSSPRRGQRRCGTGSPTKASCRQRRRSKATARSGQWRRTPHPTARTIRPGGRRTAASRSCSAGAD